MLRVLIIGGALVGETQAMLQESNGFTVVDGNAYQQWKDFKTLKTFEENGKVLVILSKSDLEEKR
jgi:tRNA U34 5-carboxymethylaminomethyl modifying GTPase MnmE/TrmE